MAKHRSLSNALLSPERMAFIKGQEADHQVHRQEQDSVVHTEPTVMPVVELTSNAPKTQNTRVEKRPAETLEATARRDVAQPNSTSTPNAEYLVAVTTRLQARTAEALRRAHLEQKLNRRDPATQQEIIELAVQEWLRTNSYLE